jgi:hypothetical protein
MKKVRTFKQVRRQNRITRLVQGGFTTKEARHAMVVRMVRSDTQFDDEPFFAKLTAAHQHPHFAPFFLKLWLDVMSVITVACEGKLVLVTSDQFRKQFPDVLQVIDMDTETRISGECGIFEDWINTNVRLLLEVSKVDYVIGTSELAEHKSKRQAM